MQSMPWMTGGDSAATRRSKRSGRDGNLGNVRPASWSREARAMVWCPGDTFDHTPGETSCISALVRLAALGHLRSGCRN